MLLEVFLRETYKRGVLKVIQFNITKYHNSQDDFYDCVNQAKVISMLRAKWI